MFIPGETVLHSFTIPFASSDISKVIVSYKQNDRIVFEKVINPSDPEDVDIVQVTEGTTNFSYRLTQAESLSFDDDARCFIQVNVLTVGGTRVASRIIDGKLGSQYVKKVI